MINTYNLFAVPVVHTKMPLPIDIHKKIILFVENNYKEGNLNSIANGFSSHEEFNGKKEMQNLLDNFLKNTCNLKIKHGWLNVLGDKSHNKPHFHAGNNVKYAGVYYLSNQNNNINFTKDGDIFELKPTLFDLLVFPATLLHYVLPEYRAEKRISFAFNLSTIGEENVT